MEDQLVTTEALSAYELSWLNFDDEVEVIWRDAEGKAQQAVGRYQGVLVPDQGGPCSFVLKAGGDEIHIDLERIAGMTRLGVSNDNAERIPRAEEAISRAAKRIDPYTARRFRRTVQVCDPYGLGYDISPELDGTDREYFLEDPKREWAVLEADVRELHPEIPDDEWEELMRAACRRNTSPDPWPSFHRYR